MKSSVAIVVTIILFSINLCGRIGSDWQGLSLRAQAHSPQTVMSGTKEEILRKTEIAVSKYVKRITRIMEQMQDRSRIEAEKEFDFEGELSMWQKFISSNLKSPLPSGLYTKADSNYYIPLPILSDRWPSSLRTIAGCYIGYLYNGRNRDMYVKINEVSAKNGYFSIDIHLVEDRKVGRKIQTNYVRARDGRIEEIKRMKEGESLREVIIYRKWAEWVMSRFTGDAPPDIILEMRIIHLDNSLLFIALPKFGEIGIAAPKDKLRKYAGKKAKVSVVESKTGEAIIEIRRNDRAKTLINIKILKIDEEGRRSNTLKKSDPETIAREAQRKTIFPQWKSFIESNLRSPAPTPFYGKVYGFSSSESGIVSFPGYKTSLKRLCSTPAEFIGKEIYVEVREINIGYFTIDIHLPEGKEIKEKIQTAYIEVIEGRIVRTRAINGPKRLNELAAKEQWSEWMKNGFKGKIPVPFTAWLSRSWKSNSLLINIPGYGAISVPSLYSSLEKMKEYRDREVEVNVVQFDSERVLIAIKDAKDGSLFETLRLDRLDVEKRLRMAEVETSI